MLPVVWSVSLMFHILCDSSLTPCMMTESCLFYTIFFPSAGKRIRSCSWSDNKRMKPNVRSLRGLSNCVCVCEDPRDADTRWGSEEWLSGNTSIRDRRVSTFNTSSGQKNHLTVDQRSLVRPERVWRPFLSLSCRSVCSRLSTFRFYFETSCQISLWCPGFLSLVVFDSL